jgi:nicotinic acid mononucleotide adenylyltransferase
MLEAAVAGRDDRAAAVCLGGLFYEIAAEFKEACGGGVEICLICGRDAAERIVAWNYGEGPSIAEQLERFQLLVASRGGRYSPPPGLEGRIRTVGLDRRFDAVSSSEVRRRIEAGDEWASLVPDAVADVIRRRGIFSG